MNIENDFLTDFDLFGKVPELYYKGKSKKSSTFGIILTIIYIILYITFLIYKLVRMFQRVDVTYYDSYVFNGLPSIKLTNNEFYGGFGMGGIIDERMYWLYVTYVSKWKENGVWKNITKPLQTEVCKLEWFGPDYQPIFADQPLDRYYCIKNVSGMVLEGYSNLERFSYFNVKFFPCVGTTADGRPCYDDTIKAAFFKQNVVELKIQDNYVNPLNYKTPVDRRQVDMNSPVFKDLFQLIYSYLQIVNIETDEDITGLNFFTDNIRKEQYMSYDHSFLIASPLLFGDIFEGPFRPIADVTLQLNAKVLTEKRQYTQLIDVLGDVGGLMEIIFTVFNLISSFVTEILYDRSLVNNLFSFDIKRKYVAFNKALKKAQQEGDVLKDMNKMDSINLQKKIEELENNKSIDIFGKENSGDKNTIVNNNSMTKKKYVKRRRSSKNPSLRNSKNAIVQLKEPEEEGNENINNAENQISSNENKNIVNIYNEPNEEINMDETVPNVKELRKVNIKDAVICCFWCTSRKTNINKILFEEGSRIITEKLDLMNIFNDLHVVEMMQKKLKIEAKGMNMSDYCKKNLHVYKNYNKRKNNQT